MTKKTAEEDQRPRRLFGMTRDQCIQVGILVVLAITLFVLWRNLVSLREQIHSREILDLPLCAIKDVDVKISEAPNVVQVYATIINSGNEVAQNVLLSMKVFAVDFKDKIPTKVSEIQNLRIPENIPKIILPKQEIKTFLFYIQKDGFNKMVIGYEKWVSIELIIKYKNMKGKTITHSASYAITRLLTSQTDIYEVSLQGNILDPPDIFSSK